MVAVEDRDSHCETAGQQRETDDDQQQHSSEEQEDTSRSLERVTGAHILMKNAHILTSDIRDTVPLHVIEEQDNDSSSSSSSEDSSSSAAEMSTEKKNIAVSEGVEIPKVNGLPRIVASTLTAHMLRDFEDYANVHFAVSTKKDLTEKRKMKLIAGCFANKEVMNWVITEAERQDDTVTFSDFLDKLRAHFLDSNWEVQVQHELLSEMMDAL